MRININGLSLAQRFVLGRAQRKIPEVFQGIRPEWIDQLITENRSLASCFTPEKIAEYRSIARQFNWVSAIISDEAFLEMVPQWFHDVVKRHGDRGIGWRTEQMSWLRSLFG